MNSGACCLFLVKQEKHNELLNLITADISPSQLFPIAKHAIHPGFHPGQTSPEV